MMLACLPFVVLLPLQPVLAAQSPEPAPAAAQPAPPVGVAADTDKERRIAAAADAYVQTKFAEAALAFEALHRDYPGEPRFLFNAGASRYAAQHYAHAVHHFNDYLARDDIQAADRKDAEAQQGEARNRVASVQLSIHVPAQSRGEVTVVVRHVGAPNAQRPELQFSGAPIGGVASVVVQTEPGVWAVQLRGDGYVTVNQSFEVRGLGPQRLDLQLPADGKRPPAPAPAATPDAAAPMTAGATPAPVPVARPRKFVIGLTVTGGVTAAVGLGVLASGIHDRRGLQSCSGGACPDDLTTALNKRDAGAGLLGAGAGLLAGGLSWFARDAALRRKLWLGGSVLGGVAAIGGSIGLVISSGNYRNTAIDDWDSIYADRVTLHAASAGVLGFGLGVLGSSLTSLLVQRRITNPKLRALRLDGAASPRLTGLVVSGRF